jgi:hypothetical protein
MSRIPWAVDLDAALQRAGDSRVPLFVDFWEPG